MWQFRLSTRYIFRFYTFPLVHTLSCQSWCSQRLVVQSDCYTTPYGHLIRVKDKVSIRVGIREVSSNFAVVRVRVRVRVRLNKPLDPNLTGVAIFT